MAHSTRAPRGEYAKSRREAAPEIVAAALEVFSEAGFHKGSIRDVADRAGLSQAGVLHHYPSKHLLLEAVLDWRDQDALARMGEEQPQGLATAPSPRRPGRAQPDHAAARRAARDASAEASAQDHPVHDYFVRRYAVVARDGHRRLRAGGRARPAPARRRLPQRRTHAGRPDGRAAGAVAAGPRLVDMAEELRRYLRPLLTVDLDGQSRPETVRRPGRRARPRDRRTARAQCSRAGPGSIDPGDTCW